MLALVLGLVALVAPTAPASPDQAELWGTRWHEMVEAIAAGREKPPPGPWAAERSITVELVDGGLVLRGRWVIRTLRPGWFLGQLFGVGIEVREATCNRQPAGLLVTREGTMVVGQVKADTILEAVAFVPGDPASAMHLGLLPAVRGALTLPPDDADLRWDLRLAGEGPPPPRRDPQVFTGDAEVILSRRPRAPESTESLITASAGLGLTFGDAELRARAHVTYQVRRGHLDAVVMEAPGLGADLTVTGRGIREWRREGSRIVVDLQAPVRDRLDLELAWTQALSKAAESSIELPRITPEGVFRSTSAVQIARDGEVEILPTLGGWTAVASADLPEWSRDLVEGTPTAAFTGGESGGTAGRIDVLRFVPVEGPPMVVDVADYTIATSQEGRVLIQAHYEVRNERAAHLRITPPPGLQIIGARVAGDTALPARGEGGAWLLPLKRSLETVKGSLSFPVEVALIGGDEQAWRRRESREIQLPRVNAPVAVTRTTLYLPPGWVSRKKPGEGDVVDGFTRGDGITYGLTVNDPSMVVEAENRFQSAVSSFLSNDFQDAQKQLDDLRSMGASNENIERLQSNLDVISGKREGGRSSGADATAERRIKEQAKARASSEIQAQVALENQAEVYRQAGEYEKAEAEYTKAIEIGDKLALLEQEESVEQQRKNDSIRTKFKAVSDTKLKKKQELDVRERFSKKNKAYQRPAESSRGGGGGGSGAGTGTSGSLASGTLGGEAVADGGHRKEPARDANGEVIDRTPGSDVARTGAVVYDFDDDTADGELLRPEGANLASRGRSQGEGVASTLTPTTTTDKVADLTETEYVPVGGTQRDFAAVVEVSPTASQDSAGIELPVTTAAESRYIVDGANINAPAFGTVGATIVQDVPSPDASLFDSPEPPGLASRRSLDDDDDAPRQSRAPLTRKRFRGLGRRRDARPSPRLTQDTATSATTPAAPAPPPDRDANGVTDLVDEVPRDLDGFEDVDGEPDDTGGANDLGRLAAPQSTASALSIVIPAAGQAVLYQRLLLAADAPYALEIGAREPLRPRKRR